MGHRLVGFTLILIRNDNCRLGIATIGSRRIKEKEWRCCPRCGRTLCCWLTVSFGHMRELPMPFGRRVILPKIIRKFHTIRGVLISNKITFSEIDLELEFLKMNHRISREQIAGKNKHFSHGTHLAELAKGNVTDVRFLKLMENPYEWPPTTERYFPDKLSSLVAQETSRRN